MAAKDGLTALRSAEHRVAVAVQSDLLGERLAGDLSLSGRPFARYWHQKLLDPTFHAGLRLVCGFSARVVLCTLLCNAQWAHRLTSCACARTGSHGGPRSFALPPSVRQLAELLLWRLHLVNPKLTIRERVAELQSVGVTVDRNWVQRALGRMGLSFKQVNRKRVRSPMRCACPT
jgi:hypothetical protein